MEDPESQLFRFLTKCFFHDEFKNTKYSRQTSFAALALTWTYFKLFNNFHPAKRLVISSVALGGFFSIFRTFSTEIFEVSQTDTVLAGKLRLYHQKASFGNVFIPFFKGETMQVYKKREKSKAVEDKNKE